MGGINNRNTLSPEKFKLAQIFGAGQYFQALPCAGERSRRISSVATSGSARSNAWRTQSTQQDKTEQAELSVHCCSQDVLGLGV